MSDKWEPTPRLRWNVVNGKNVLQQLHTMQRPPLDTRAYPIIQEWRDVKIEQVEVGGYPADSERGKHMGWLGDWGTCKECPPHEGHNSPDWNTDTVKLMWQKVEEERMRKAQEENKQLKTALRWLAERYNISTRSLKSDFGVSLDD